MDSKTLREVSSAWQEDKRHYVKQSTFAAYLLILQNHILPYFGDMCNFEEADVQNFVLKKLDGGLSVKTIKDILIVLKMVVKFGVKKHWFPHVEWDIKYPTQASENKQIEVLSITDNKKILDYVVQNFTFRNLGIYLSLTTGMRIGEICALKWSDIDLNTGMLKVQRTIERIYIIEGEKKYTQVVINTPKTSNSNREIPLNKEVLPLIKSLMKVVNKDFFVISNDPKPIEPRTYRTYYKQFMDELKMPKIKFHGLRHTFATRCIESNCDYKTVSVLLGHADISTTLNLYVHPNEEQKKKCVNTMFKSLGK